jgi:predicted enzyme related to lactoylglutathione lyase
VTAFREAFPIISVDDVDRAVEFYGSMFGFEQTYSFEEEGTKVFAFLRLDPLGIGIARRAAPDDPDFALWLYTDDVDEAAGRLRAAGAQELLAPTDQPWGERMCTFRDADGTVLHVASKP